MKRIWVPIFAFVYSVGVLGAPTTLDCQSSTELDENLRDIAEATGGVGGADDCPAPSASDLSSLCNQVDSRTPDNDENSPFDHLYEKSIWKLSCADFTKDSEQVGRKKVQTMWKKHHNEFRCNKTNFTVANGNILKYAVQSTFEEFILKLVKEYKIDINFIDPKDGKTVLDFTKEEMDKRNSTQPDSVTAKAISSLYSKLKDLGALHSNELKK